MRFLSAEPAISGTKVMIEVENQGKHMLKLSHLDHIVLRVSNLDAMTTFYCSVLGCTIERRQDAIGLLQLRAGKCLIDLVPVDGKLGKMGGAGPGPDGRNLDHFCFCVEPFDAAAIYAHLARHGVAGGALESRYGAAGQGPSIYLQDPEGNNIELKGPPLEPSCMFNDVNLA